MKEVAIKRKTHSADGSKTLIYSSLTLAELYIQRADFGRARELLERRQGQGARDFPSQNLLAISHAQLGGYDQAEEIFRKLAQTGPRHRREKARFNLGLVLFFRDLSILGDCSVSRHVEALPTPESDWVGKPLLAQPFSAAVKVWTNLISRRAAHRDLVLTFLSFAHLQAGEIEPAIERLMEALTISENFYIAHYVLGRVFLDLYYLAAEENDYTLSRDAALFFEIEEYEIIEEVAGRVKIQKDTYLDIALQGFLEARSLNQLAPEALLGLCHTYMMAGMMEEAYDILTQAESYANGSLAFLELSLRFHERVQSTPETIRTLIEKIKQTRSGDSTDQISYVIPPYYLN